MKVYLDDIRETPEGWARTKTASETIELLKSDKVSCVSLDHDLGEGNEQGTGNDVLVWIESQVFTNPNYIPPMIIIHTSNVSAAQKMKAGVQRIREERVRRTR